MDAQTVQPDTRICFRASWWDQSHLEWRLSIDWAGDVSPDFIDPLVRQLPPDARRPARGYHAAGEHRSRSPASLAPLTRLPKRKATRQAGLIGPAWIRTRARRIMSPLL